MIKITKHLSWKKTNKWKDNAIIMNLKVQGQFFSVWSLDLTQSESQQGTYLYKLASSYSHLNYGYMFSAT